MADGEKLELSPVATVFSQSSPGECNVVYDSVNLATSPRARIKKSCWKSDVKTTIVVCLLIIFIIDSLVLHWRLSTLLTASNEDRNSFKWPSGQVGPKGTQGTKGDKGDQGTHGFHGIPASPGLAGPAGQPGPSGSMGPIGQVGPRGPSGQKGIEGIKVDKGINGVKGIQGPTGPIGP